MCDIIDNDNNYCQIVIIKFCHKGGEKCDMDMQLLR